MNLYFFSLGRTVDGTTISNLLEEQEIDAETNELAIMNAEAAVAERGHYVGDLLALLEDEGGEIIWHRQFNDGTEIQRSAPVGTGRQSVGNVE